eukprot:506983-Hanusia_phi.AAC.2
MQGMRAAQEPQSVQLERESQRRELDCLTTLLTVSRRAKENSSFCEYLPCSLAAEVAELDVALVPFEGLELVKLVEYQLQLADVPLRSLPPRLLVDDAQ